MVFYISLLSVGIFLAHPVRAATLYLAPSGGSYNVGDTFTVGVFVSSPDQALNAVSGALNVSRERLEIVSVTPGGSIINLWVRDPSFSTADGRASFEGIVLNPGFEGSGGLVMSTTLKVISTGAADIRLSSGVVLANDGLGTNILHGIGTAQFTINGPDIPSPPESPDEPPEAQALTDEPSEAQALTDEPLFLPEPREPEPASHVPVVVSETHPDPDGWYTKRDVTLSWSVPDSATAVRLLVSQNPDDLPTMLYNEPINSIELNSLSDGVWYLHIQFRASLWSEVTHFRFQIDTQPPEAFEFTEIPRSDLTDPIVRFNINATDTTSGIDSYEMFIDGKRAKAGLNGNLSSVSTPILAPGDHDITVRAVDRAGNARESTARVKVDPLLPPILLQYPFSLEYGDVFFVRGTTEYLNARVTLWIRGKGKDPLTYEFLSDSEGNISFLTKERLPKGEVEIWLTVQDERGALSDPSDHAVVTVHGLLLSDFWPWFSYILLVIAFALAFLLQKNRRQLAALRKRLRDAGGRGDDEYATLEQELELLRKEIETKKKAGQKPRVHRKAGRGSVKPGASRSRTKSIGSRKIIIGNKRGRKDL